MSLPVFAPAIFNESRTHRYTLFRSWQKRWKVETQDKGYVQFICLNPSTADEVQNDPTVTRCIKYAERWGYSGMWMTNIFAYRATDPRDMKAFEEPVGDENDYWLKQIAMRADLIVCAWGNHGQYRQRSDRVRRVLKGFDLTYLKMTKANEPGHPLYLRGDLEPTPYLPETINA